MARPSPSAQEGKGLLGRVAGRVTGRVVETFDPDVVLDHVDVDALLARIDVNALLDRVDVNRLLARIDPNVLLDRVDVDRLLERIDVEAVVRRSGVPDIVAASTGRMAGSALDLARRQVAGLDAILDRVIDRLMRRPQQHLRLSPPLLATERGTGSTGARQTVTGHYAGPVSRLAAVFIDGWLVVAVYTALFAGLDTLLGAFFGSGLGGDRSSPLAVAALACWGFLYVFVCLAVAGRTFGKGLLGVRVVRADGGPLTVGRAFRRTVLFPFSGALAGLGFVPVLLHREHRALHDLGAGTAVVYDWGERPAELPGPLSAFLRRDHTL